MSNGTYNVLLSEAKKEFFENGFENVSGRYLCEKCGVSRSRLKYYFGTKEDIGEIILDNFLMNLYSEYESKIGCTLQNTKNDRMLSAVLKLSIFIDDVLIHKDYSPFFLEFISTTKGHSVLYRYYKQEFDFLNQEEKLWDKMFHVISYSKIFVNALASNTRKYFEITDDFPHYYSYIYASLLLKLFDYPIEERSKILVQSADLYNKISVRIKSFNSVNIEYNFE